MKRKNYEMPSVEEVLVLVEQGFAASQVEKPDDDTNEYWCVRSGNLCVCLLYTSDAADEL